MEPAATVVAATAVMFNLRGDDSTADPEVEDAARY